MWLTLIVIKLSGVFLLSITKRLPSTLWKKGMTTSVLRRCLSQRTKCSTQFTSTMWCKTPTTLIWCFSWSNLAPQPQPCWPKRYSAIQNTVRTLTVHRFTTSFNGNLETANLSHLSSLNSAPKSSTISTRAGTRMNCHRLEYYPGCQFSAYVIIVVPCKSTKLWRMKCGMILATISKRRIERRLQWTIMTSCFKTDLIISKQFKGYFQERNLEEWRQLINYWFATGC